MICYFSAGSYEDFRDDATAFPSSAIGEPLDGWPGEWWLDVRDRTGDPTIAGFSTLVKTWDLDAWRIACG